MKCKHCNETGKVRGYFYEKTGVNKWEKVWGDSPCDECGGTGKIQQTNDEWRKTCSAEEFAEWIADKINAKLRMALHDAELYDGDVNENEYMENEDEWVEWLKQPTHCEVVAK
jgi:DnaJ-class molecular chaperone